MATNQHRSAAYLGLLSVGLPGNTTFALSGAASGGFAGTWLAYSWNPSESKTISAIKARVSAVAAGPLGTNDCVCDIYSDTAGVGPNASLASSNTVTIVPTANSWVEFTGFSLAVTAGTQYWIVLRNANAAPTVTFPTYAYGNPNSWIGAGQSEAASFWGSGSVLTSVNSGGAWSSSIAAYSTGWRVQYSDGTYDGTPISSQGLLGAGSASFGKQAVGVQLVTPPNAVWNVRGAQMCFNKTGTPGNGVFKLYNGSTLLGTSAGIPVANVTNSRCYAAMFPSTIIVQPGTTLNLVLCDLTTGDTSANVYKQMAYTIDNDANSFALMPFEGTLALVTTTDYTASSPTFTKTQTQVVPFSLILDSTGEFGPFFL